MNMQPGYHQKDSQVFYLFNMQISRPVISSTAGRSPAFPLCKFYEKSGTEKNLLYISMHKSLLLLQVKRFLLVLGENGMSEAVIKNNFGYSLITGMGLDKVL
jgi:hypothetical protein